MLRTVAFGPISNRKRLPVGTTPVFAAKSTVSASAPTRSMAETVVSGRRGKRVQVVHKSLSSISCPSTKVCIATETDRDVIKVLTRNAKE